MKKDNGIDLTHGLIWALGSNEALHQDITIRYKQKEVEYYKFYKESKYYNDPLFQSLNTQTMEVMKQATGIILKEIDEGKDDIILKLVKKGFKKAYNYVIHKTYIEFEPLLMDLMDEIYGGNDSSFLPDVVVALFLAVHFEKEFDISSPSLQMVLQTVDLQMSMYTEEKTVIEEQVKKFAIDVAAEKERMMVPNKKEVTISELLLKHVTNDTFFRNGQLLTELDEVVDSYYGEGFSKFNAALNSLYRSLGFNHPDLLRRIKINQEQIEHLLAHYFWMVESGQLSETDKDSFLAYSLSVFAMLEEYKQTREKYLEQMKDKYYYDLDEYRQELLEQNRLILTKKEEIKQQRIEMKKERESILHQNKQLLKELEECKKKIVQLEKDKDQQESKNKELYALREHLFTQQSVESDEIIVSDEHLEKMRNEIQKLKIVIIGGHPNWQTKLKETYKQFVFVSADERGKDLSFIDKTDIVFINTSYNSHTLYKRVVSQLNKSQVPLAYIHQSTNFNRVTQEIYEGVVTNKIVESCFT